MMPQLPAALNNPGTLLALCLIGAIVIGVNATLVSMLRRGSDPGAGSHWGTAFVGARERQRQQTAQMDELHRAVADLSAYEPGPDQPHE